MSETYPVAAELGTRRFPGAAPCVHCLAPVRETGHQHDWLPKYEHYDPDASFRDEVWTYCRRTTAIPLTPSDDARCPCETPECGAVPPGLSKCQRCLSTGCTGPSDDASGRHDDCDHDNVPCTAPPLGPPEGWPGTADASSQTS